MIYIYIGTEITFKPGTLFGGDIVFDCGLERSVVYFLQPLVVLAPFSKYAFRVTLNGITSDNLDGTVDGFKNSDLRILKFFEVSEGVDFKINKRGSHPDGGGEVFFTCPVIFQLRPINLTDTGLVKKIRGVAAVTRVNPQIANRLVEAARSQLNSFIPDIYIYTDVFQGSDAGKSPGYSIFLQAESTTGALISADATGMPGACAEDISVKAARSLLSQILNGGFVSQSHQWLVLILMALCPEDLSKVVFGPLYSQLPILLEDIGRFLGVTYKIIKSKSDSSLNEVSCVGSGLFNFNRRTQ